MNQKKLNRKSIVVVQLQHDMATTSLKVRAISEVLAKVLYQYDGQPLAFGRLMSKAAGLVKLPQVPEDLAKSGLLWLKENGWATESNKGWQLTSEGEERISGRHNESEQRITDILQKHFGSQIEALTLRQWFLQASSIFFAEFGLVISRALLREAVSFPSRSHLQNILKQSIEEEKLQEHENLLINGFGNFLNDIDPKAEAQKMSFALATLSAQLIAAASGPDPISLPEFENAKLFLDTNVLLLERVEIRNHEMSRAMVALAQALNSIGATLHIIRPTKEEYESVVSRKKSAVMKILKEGVSFGVLEKSGDSFIKTAIKNGAVNESDFERFFDSIAEVPKSIGPVPITLLEFPEIQKEIENGVANSKKKSQIIAEWKKLRGKNKNVLLAEHDAALDSAALFCKKENGKGWVITRDRSMLNLSKRWQERQGLPIWVYLEALIEILAVYGAGPTYKSEEFAPLLGALIRSDVQETFASFQIEDLGELADIDARAFELSDEEVINYAEKLHQMRLSGESVNSSDIQLHIRRTFQGRRLKDNNEAEKIRAEVRNREQKIAIGQDIAIAALANQLIPKIKRDKMFQRWTPYIIIGLIICFGIYIAYEENQKEWLISLIIAIVVDVGIPILTMFFNPIDKIFLINQAKMEAKVLLEQQDGVIDH